MKVGDLVVRAYAYHKVEFGIITEIQHDMVQTAADMIGEDTSWEEITVIVIWADGSRTRELDIELDFLEDAVSGGWGSCE